MPWAARASPSPVATRSPRRATRAPLSSAPRLRGGRGQGPGGFGTFRGSLQPGGTQAAGSAPRPAAARSGPEGEQAASTEVSAVAGRAGAVCGRGNPLPTRGQRGRLARAPALAATDSGGPTARSSRAAAGHGRGRRWAPGGGRDPGEARAGGGLRSERAARGIRRHLSTHPLSRVACALGPRLSPPRSLAGDRRCWGV